MEELSGRQLSIINLLLDLNEPITSVEIGKKVNSSEKTVRNDIGYINTLYNSQIKSIKGKGYLIENKNEVKKILNISDNQVLNRQLLIYKHILSKGIVDYYELADEYYISESTLDNDIKILNKNFLELYNIAITRNNNQLIITGDEESKRKVYTSFLLDEIDNFNFNLNNYSNYFKYSDLNELKEIIINFFQKENIRFNDIEIVSFIIHIAILIDRVKEDKSIKNFSYIEIIENKESIDKFCSLIENEFNIKLINSERNYIASLLSNRINTKIKNEFDESKMSNFIEQVLLDINNYYQIDLNHDEILKNDLQIHLISLRNRLSKNHSLNNPLITEIKNNFPLIYDISVFMSLKIQDFYSTILCEDEIGFISLHLMVAVEKLKKDKLRIAIVDPLTNKNSIYYQNRLNFYLPNDLDVVNKFSMFELDELRKEKIDFILTTVPLYEEFLVPIIRTSPLLIDEDISNLSLLIKKIKDNKQKNYELVISQLNPKLFFPQLDFNNKTDLLKYMCNQLVINDYVNDNYYNLVMERENIAPTCFGGLFAIPHPIKKEANKAGIAIASLKESIEWSNQKVKLVILFSLTNESKNLTKLYESLVKMLDDPSKVKKLSKIIDYNEFVDEFIGK